MINQESAASHQGTYRSVLRTQNEAYLKWPFHTFKFVNTSRHQIETDDQYQGLRADFLREFANMNRDGSVE